MPRIALQGGGARLADLLATASAIYQSGICCNAYAGTSAGSLAAAVLAAGKDPRRLREFFLQNRGRIESLIPGSGRLSLLSQAYKVGFQGKPIIDLEIIRTVISNALTALEISHATAIGTLPTPLFVIAANVRDSTPRIYRDDDNLLDSLVRSCAIPIIFTASSTHDRHIVDGGVFNNLPADVLLEMPGDPEDVIAVAFKDNFVFHPKNAVQYVSDIFSAMIDARVQDSIIRVGRDNVYQIDTKISSFSVRDFYSGLAEGAFDERERHAKEWIEGWISKDRVQFKDFRSLHRHPGYYTGYMCNKINALADLFSGDPSPTLSGVDITIKPSINTDDDGYDGLISVSKLQAHPDLPQHAYIEHTVTQSGAEQFISADWEVSDHLGNVVPHVAVPLVEPRSPRMKVVVLFGKPLLPVSEGGVYYQIRQRQIIKGLMDKLPEDDDWFSLRIPEGESIEVLRLSLATRRGWGKFRQEGADGAPGKPSQRSHPDDDERNVLSWEVHNLIGGAKLHVNYSRIKQ